MIYPSPDKLDLMDSKYALVIVAAKRARQIKDGARRLNRVLTNDPGIGVARHVDAGYEDAQRTANEKNIKIPK